MGKKKCRLIAYYRVSTKKQGESGLGLEAQEAAVAAYVASSGCELLAAYKEVESGKNSARPQLKLAVDHAKRAKATLVIAKMDRLSRNVAFIANLLESDVEFVACDNPHANRLTVHILAAVAEQEARAISERTKAALAAAKARGVKLGAPHHLTHAGALKGAARSVAVRKANKAEAYAYVQPLIHELREQGLSFDAIAKRLNELGHETRNQKRWGAAQVRRVLLMPREVENRPLPFRLAA